MILKITPRANPWLALAVSLNFSRPPKNKIVSYNPALTINVIFLTYVTCVQLNNLHVLYNSAINNEDRNELQIRNTANYSIL